MVDAIRKRASSIFSGGDQDASPPPAPRERLSVDVLLHALAPAPVNPQPPEGDDEPPLLDLAEGGAQPFSAAASMPAGVGGHDIGRHLAQEALAALQDRDDDDGEIMTRSKSMNVFQRPGQAGKGGSRESFESQKPRQSFGNTLGEDLLRRVKSEHDAAAEEPTRMMRMTSVRSTRSSNHSSAGGMFSPRTSVRSRGQRYSSRQSKSSVFSAGGLVQTWRESIMSAGTGIRKSGSEFLKRASASSSAANKTDDSISADKRRSSVQSIASAIASLARASHNSSESEDLNGEGAVRSSAASMDEERFHRSQTEISGAGFSVTGAGSLRSTDVFVFDFFVMACPRAVKNIGRRLRFNCLRVASAGIASLLRSEVQRGLVEEDLTHKKGQGCIDSYIKAETAFNEELADVMSDGSSENLSDIEEHPWQEYFTHRNHYAHSLSDLVAGVPTSERVLLKKIGIEVTKKKDLREFLRSIKGTRRQSTLPGVAEDSTESKATDEGSNKDAPSTADDLAEVLGDSLVDWSYYDLFEPDRSFHERDYARLLISGFSTLSRISEETLLCIAFFSTWYATLVFCFREVIAADSIFGPDTAIYRFLASLDVVLDGVYLIFTLLRLRTTIVDTSAYKEVTRPRAILRTLFTAPMYWGEFLTCAVMPVRVACGLQSTFSLQIGTIRVLRVWRVAFPPQNAVRSARHWVWSMLKFVLLLLLAGHLWGCAWFLMADSSMDIQKHPLILDSAPDRVAAFNETPWALALYYSYAWRLGVYLVIGADWVGMSSNENLMAAVMAPIGALISAVVFSQVIVMMQRDSAVQTMYAKHVIEVKQALATLDLPRYLQLRILAFYAYQQLHRSEHVSHSLRRMLSPQLQFELHLVLYYGLVKKSRLFHLAPPRVLREIVVVLKDRIFLPGDFVYRAREEAREMFFICKGSCSILDQDLSTQHQILRIGDSFGEIPLLCGHPHISYIRAGTYCILAILSKGHFEGVMRLYPKMAEILLKQMSQQERELMQKRTSFQAAVRRRSSLGRRFSRVNSFSAGRANSIVNVAEMRSSRRSTTEPGTAPQIGSSGFPIYSPRPSSQQPGFPSGLKTPRLSTASLHSTVRSRQASMMDPAVQQPWKAQGNNLRVPQLRGVGPQLQRLAGGGSPAPNRMGALDNVPSATPGPPPKLHKQLTGKLTSSNVGDSSSSDDDTDKKKPKSNLQGNANRRKSLADIGSRKPLAESGHSAPPPRRKSMVAHLSGAQDDPDSPKPARRKSLAARQADSTSCPASLRRSSVLDAHGRRKSITAIALEAGSSVAMGGRHMAMGHSMAMGQLPAGLHPGLMPQARAVEETPVEEQAIVQEEAPLPAPLSPPSDSGSPNSSQQRSVRSDAEAEASCISDPSRDGRGRELPRPGPLDCLAEGPPMAAWTSEATTEDNTSPPQSPGGRSAMRSSLKDSRGVRNSLAVPSRSSRSHSSGHSADTGTRRSVTLAPAPEADKPVQSSPVEEEAVVPFFQGEAEGASDEATESPRSNTRLRRSVTLSSQCEEMQIEGRSEVATDAPSPPPREEVKADDAKPKTDGSSSSSSDTDEQPDSDADAELKTPAPRKMSITLQKVDVAADESSNNTKMRTSTTSIRSSEPVSILEVGPPPDDDSDAEAGDDDDEDKPPVRPSITVNEPEMDAVVKSISVKSIKSDNSQLSKMSFAQSIPSINSARSGHSGIVSTMISSMQAKGAKLRDLSRYKKDSGGGRSVIGGISKAFKSVAGSIVTEGASRPGSRAPSQKTSRANSVKGSRHQSASASRNASRSASRMVSRTHSSRPSNPASRQDSRRPSQEPRSSGQMNESMQLAQKLEELLHQQERDKGTRGSTGSVSTLAIPEKDGARYSSQRSSLSQRSSIISADVARLSLTQPDGVQYEDDSDEDLSALNIPATIHARAEQMAFVESPPGSGRDQSPLGSRRASRQSPLGSRRGSRLSSRGSRLSSRDQSPPSPGRNRFDPMASARSENWQAKNQTRSSMEAQPSNRHRSNSTKEVPRPTRSMSWPCSKRDFLALQKRLQSIVASGALDSPTSASSLNSPPDKEEKKAGASKFVSSPPRMSDDPYDSYGFEPTGSQGLLDIGMPLTLSPDAHERKMNDLKAKTQHNTNLMAVVTDSVVAATKSTRSVLKDLNLVSGEMKDLTKAVIGMCDELRDAMPKEDIESGYSMEASMEEGGFGALEATQAMDVVMRQIKVLQTIAEKVAMQFTHNQGADEVIIEAMAGVEPGGENTGH